MGLASVLTVIFIVLKLVHVIHWPWLAVLSPTLIDLGIGIVLILGVAATRRSRRRRYERPSRWGT